MPLNAFQKSLSSGDCLSKLRAGLIGEGLRFDTPFGSQTANMAYEMAGVGPEDVNVVELHDAFAPMSFVEGRVVKLQYSLRRRVAKLQQRGRVWKKNILFLISIAPSYALALMVILEQT